MVHEYDAGAICDIYNEYVTKTHFTFEVDILTKSLIRDRIQQVSQQFPWYVCEIGDEVVGYAYANHWKSRSAYRFSAESTIYLKQDFTGSGVGSELYENLIGQLKISGFHTILASIALPNNISIRFHEKFGYKQVGVIKEVGFKFERRIDVAIFQLMLV